MADVKEYDFKSVGTKTTTVKQSNPLENRPIGIRTPMRLGQSNDGIFAMHRNISDQIKDNLRNLILTNHGERVGVYDFGANLKPLSLELASDVLDEEILIRINTAVSKFMPYVVLDRAQREIDHLDNLHVAKLNLRIYYSVPQLNISNQAIDIVLFIGG